MHSWVDGHSNVLFNCNKMSHSKCSVLNANQLQCNTHNVITGNLSVAYVCL